MILQTPGQADTKNQSTSISDSSETAPGDTTVKKKKKLPRFVAEQVAKGLKATWTVSSSFVAEPGRVEKTVREFFSPHGQTIGWFPLFEITSGTRPEAGLGLFFKRGMFYSDFRGMIADEMKDKYEIGATWKGLSEESKPWQFHINLMQKRDDDLWFYGIGVDPQNDKRSEKRVSREAS